MAAEFTTEGECSDPLMAFHMKETAEVDALEQELAQIDPKVMPIAHRFISKELERLKVRENPEFIRKDASVVRLVQKVLVPVHEAPEFNFVGKILGPKGEHMKRIAQETHTKLAIMGRGSKKERAEEDKLLATGDPEHDHLNYPLHVRVEAKDHPSRVWGNLQKSLDMIVPLMVADPPSASNSLWANGPGHGRSRSPPRASDFMPHNMDQSSMYRYAGRGGGHVMDGYMGRGGPSYGGGRYDGGGKAPPPSRGYGRGRGRGRGYPY